MSRSRSQVTNNIRVQNGMVCIKDFKNLRQNKEDKEYITTLFNTALEETLTLPLPSKRLTDKKEGNEIDGYITMDNYVLFYLSTDRSIRPLVDEENGAIHRRFVLTNNKLVLCTQQPEQVSRVPDSKQTDPSSLYFDDTPAQTFPTPPRQHPRGSYTALPDPVPDPVPVPDPDSDSDPPLSRLDRLRDKFGKLSILQRLLIVLGLGTLLTAIAFLTGGAIAAACGIGFVTYATFTGTAVTAGTLPLACTWGGSTAAIGGALDPDWLSKVKVPTTCNEFSSLILGDGGSNASGTRPRKQLKQPSQPEEKNHFPDGSKPSRKF